MARSRIAGTIMLLLSAAVRGSDAAVLVEARTCGRVRLARSRFTQQHGHRGWLSHQAIASSSSAGTHVAQWPVR